MSKNLFCESNDLHNEADVEQVFARRLIEYLDYTDKQIRPKDTLEALTVGGIRGQQALYRPDFAIKVGDDVRWILEAKSPDENLDKHLWQPKGYCAVLNGQYTDSNPVQYYVLSNGNETRLYKWDVNEPILVLRFAEIIEGNPKFVKFMNFLDPKQFIQKPAKNTSKLHVLEKRPIGDVNAAFAWCHQHIYKKDNISQAAAFTEFTKVEFLKLLSDRTIRDKYPEVIVNDAVEIPLEDVRFSLSWINYQKKHTPNPLDDILFP